MTSPRIDVLPRPLRDDQWTRALLIERLKIGMQVELCTIPLYLYAYYSINVEASIPSAQREAGARARFSILGVVQQEMLHLTLLGNLLRAVDAVPILYMENFIPTYPDTLLSSNVPMSLTRAGRESFENFLKIEAPYYPPPPATPPASASEIGVRNALPNDHSIGEFYMNLVRGIEILSKTENLFARPQVELQFGSDMFNRDIQIKDKDTALKAIELITEQGEGGDSVPESHYTVFADLYHRPQSWACYDVLRDPKSAKYPAGAVKELALAFNASYCYLLLTIQEVWRVDDVENRRHLIRNVHSIMMVVISPLAALLVQQRTTYNKGQDRMNAGPCFEHFPAPATAGTELDRLYRAISDRLIAAYSSAPGLKYPIERLFYSIRGVAPFRPRSL